MTQPPRQLIGHCGPLIMALIMSGSCDDPSDGGTTRHRRGVIQSPTITASHGKRGFAYLYSRFSSPYLRWPCGSALFLNLRSLSPESRILTTSQKEFPLSGGGY
ncbi:hypothetical protein AVEN_212754-1 [Araneus ventricosus]|uniref:Uncharacterized protein n=1 Tax=Araneus ventricosus TaxID=182803 RepID=A0A4Y2H040_ARAVE|nr:hypothetical protein AVEN_212754-1 [Araneus ventricosus]